MIKLGQKVKDRITGFVGTVTGRAEYISGCSQLLVAPLIDKDGAFRESHWFDEQRCEVDLNAEVVVLDNGNTPGFDKPAPIR